MGCVSKLQDCGIAMPNQSWWEIQLQLRPWNYLVWCCDGHSIGHVVMRPLRAAHGREFSKIFFFIDITNIPFAIYTRIPSHCQTVSPWSNHQVRLQDTPRWWLHTGLCSHTKVLKRYLQCQQYFYTCCICIWALELTGLHFLSSEQHQLLSWYLSLGRRFLEMYEWSGELEWGLDSPDPPDPSSFPTLYQPPTCTKSNCRGAYGFLEAFSMHIAMINAECEEKRGGKMC